MRPVILFFLMTLSGLAANVTNLYTGLGLYTGQALSTLPAGGGGATPAFVGFATNSAFASSGSNTTAAITCTSGNCLVAHVSWEQKYHSVFLSDDKTNLWNALGQTNRSGDAFGQIFWASNITGGTVTLTVTAIVTNSPSYTTNTHNLGVVIVEASGCSITSPYDKSSKDNAFGTSVASGLQTTTSANELLLAFVKNVNGKAMNPQASWTEFDDNPTFGLEAQYRVVTSTGSYQGAASTSDTNNAQMTCCFITLK